ncbi:TVP38/TMEM64 family protein [Streptococcus caprae]|uniref:TVP38/TMEM64 family membrane protein n=1 Tax=Streptococcus caprae TaxID=1640501 RepID=A0ABV8CZE5_9STRE
MNNPTGNKRYQRWQKIIHFLGFVSILFTIILIAYLLKGLDIMNKPDALAELIRGHYFLGTIIFFLIQIIQVVIPIIPGGVTTVVGFLAFGPVMGFLLNYIGILIGSILLFWLVRRFGRPFILLFIDEKRLEKFEHKLSNPTYDTFFALSMLSPVSPADIIVMVTGLTKMSYRKFLLIIILCKPLSIFCYGYFWIYGGTLLGKIF